MSYAEIVARVVGRIGGAVATRGVKKAEAATGRVLAEIEAANQQFFEGKRRASKAFSTELMRLGTLQNEAQTAFYQQLSNIDTANSASEATASVQEDYTARIAELGDLQASTDVAQQGAVSRFEQQQSGLVDASQQAFSQDVQRTDRARQEQTQRQSLGQMLAALQASGQDAADLFNLTEAERNSAFAIHRQDLERQLTEAGQKGRRQRVLGAMIMGGAEGISAVGNEQSRSAPRSAGTDDSEEEG